MTKLIFIFVSISILFGFKYSTQRNASKSEVSYTESPSEGESINGDIYPFKLRNNDGQYAIIIEIESGEIFNKYSSLFEKYGYSGNGYCWEGHIIQILEKLNPELIKHIDFDPEAGSFFAIADSKNNQSKFVSLLSPILSDLKKFEPYVKSADHSKIQD